MNLQLRSFLTKGYFYIYITTGLLGVIMEAFFNQHDGLFGNTPKWEKLGIQLVGSIAIIVWSGFWSFVVFFSLRKIKWKGNNILRLDGYTGRV